MKRKQFLLGIMALPLLSACSISTLQAKPAPQDIENSQDTPLDDIIKSSIDENLSLTFGNPENTLEKVSFILNLGNTESLQFLFDNISQIQNKIDNDEFFEILLVNLSSENQQITYSPEMSSILSSVAMYAYADSPELFISFLQIALNRWNEQETFEKEDVIYIAQELELLPNLDITGTNAISQSYITKMTEKAEEFTDITPAVLINDSLWSGNINNPVEVNQLFNPVS